MTPAVRRAIPIFMTALALAACDSGTPRRTPTGPLGPVSGEEGRLSAMAVAPPLGTAASFGVLGGSTVTNTGPTVVNGDLGISPGAACTGFPAPCTGGGPGTVTGTIHAADALALSAQNAITTAYNSLAGQACNVNLTGQDLGGLTLTPGVYCFSTSAQLTGTLTLNGLGNAGAVWVFQIGSTLTTASGSRVAFVNAGQACGTFWQVGSSATVGTTSAFAGNVLALASVTMNTGATNAGGLFARTGAATLDSNIVSTVGSCGAGPQPTPTPLPTPTPPVPTLPQMATWGLLAILLISGAVLLGRR